MSLHEFDSVCLLLAKGDSDSLKSLWSKHRILGAARISDVLRALEFRKRSELRSLQFAGDEHYRRQFFGTYRTASDCIDHRAVNTAFIGD
jgi:hypothetical protein